MKELLKDIIRQTEPLFERVRVTGGHGEVRVEAHTDDMMLFLLADLKADEPAMTGEFGLSNLNLLSRLLDFPPYKGEQGQFEARRSPAGDSDYCSEFLFSGPGCSASFLTINPRMNTDRRPRIAEIHWDAEVAPSKSKLTELMQLTGMLSQLEQQFTVLNDNHRLILKIGGRSVSSHTANVVLADDVECGSMPSNMAFKTPQFLNVLKNVGNRPCMIRFAKDGVASVKVETEFGAYNYILRGVEA